LPSLFGTAESDQGLPPRFLLTQPRAYSLVCIQGHVAFELCFKLVLRPPRAQQPQQKRP
jgi:hypothetical protein